MRVLCTTTVSLFITLTRKVPPQRLSCPGPAPLPAVGLDSGPAGFHHSPGPTNTAQFHFHPQCFQKDLGNPLFPEASVAPVQCLCGPWGHRPADCRDPLSCPLSLVSLPGAESTCPMRPVRREGRVSALALRCSAFLDLNKRPLHRSFQSWHGPRVTDVPP